MKPLQSPAFQTSRWLSLAFALFPAIASAGLLESYESSVPPIPAAPTPYLAIEQSSTIGVTQGVKSMKVVYDATSTWQWFGTDFPSSAYADWHANDIVLFDVHRPAQSGNSKLNLVMALNGPMGWTQQELVAWAWLNAGDSSTETLSFDYRAIRGAAPLPGAGLPEHDDYLQLNFMARSDMEVATGATGPGVGGEVYIDNVRFVRSVPPPPVALYTFDEGAEGFQHYNGTSPDATFTTNFGGAIKLAAGAGDDATYYWHCGKEINAGYQLDRLKSLAANGGTISYDVIGAAGTLAGHGFTVAIKVYNTWKFIQVSHTVDAGEVVALDDGNEIARITLDAAQFGPDFIVQSGYGYYLGYNGTKVYHLDNVVFSPNPENGGTMTFDATVQNFTALPGSTTTWDPAGQLVITGPPTYDPDAGSKAVFTANSGDAQVAAVYAQLVAASQKGGMLSYKLKKIHVTGRESFFSDFYVKTSLNGDDDFPYLQWIPEGDLTEGGNPDSDPVVLPDETPAGYNRNIRIKLYPAGSIETDGFVLPVNATSYQFNIKVDADDGSATSVSLNIDDFSVIANADPQIVYSPPAPMDGGSFVGRVLSNMSEGCEYSATGLPPGLVIDAATGLVHGTPTANGSYHVVFSVTRGGVTDFTEEMDWEITGVGPASDPVITSFTTAPGTATLTWTGAISATVLRSTTMASGSWEKVSENNTTGTYTDNSAPAGKAFYRVSVP